jgi:MFS family permease
MNKWNNITKMALISFFSTLYFYSPIATLYCQKRGLNFLQINALDGIIFGVMSLAEVPTGIIADRIGRKFSIIMSLFLQLIGEVIYIFANAYWHFVGVVIIAGVSWSFASGCVDALIYDSLKEKGQEQDMSKAMGLFSASAQLSQVIAPLVGGFIVSSLTMNKFILAIAMTAISVTVALFISFFLKEPKAEPTRSEESSFTLLKDGVKLLRHNASLQRIVLLSLFTSSFAGYFYTLYQPYFLKSNVLPVWLGLARSTGAILAIAGSKYAWLLENHIGVKRSAFLATASPGAFYLLMSLVYHPALSVVLFCLAYGSISLEKPLFARYRNIYIESKNRATVLSIITMFAGMYEALMGLFIGSIADYHFSYAFMFMGGIILLGAGLFRINENHLIRRQL